MGEYNVTPEVKLIDSTESLEATHIVAIYPSKLATIREKINKLEQQSFPPNKPNSPLTPKTPTKTTI